MIYKLKKSKFLRHLSKSAVFCYLRSSHGNVAYPWLNLTWILAAWLVPRRKVFCDGVSFTLSCGNPITYFRWFLFSRKEVEVRHYINKFIKNGDVFFDVGANVGVFTLYAACRYPKTKVFSFEPEHSNLGLLKENVLANGLMDRVKITSVAVSNQQSLSFLNIQDTMPGAAAHSEHRRALKVTEEGFGVEWQEGVVTATLDKLAAHWGVYPNGLKIDTDGNEDKVLLGAGAVLGRRELRSIILEMPLKKAKIAICEKLLKNTGFKLIWSKHTTRNQIWVKTR